MSTLFEKAHSHKYIKRTGIPGHFEYTYSEEARRDAEQDIGGIKDLNFRPELTVEDKRLKYHLDKLFEAVEGVNEGIHRPEKAGMLIDKIKQLTGTTPAYALGKTITGEQAVELWKEYKKVTAEALKELDAGEMTPEIVHKFEVSSFLHQMMRETVAGYLGEEGNLAFTPDEIEEKLGLTQGVKEEAGEYSPKYTNTGEIATFSGEQFRVLVDKNGRKVYEPADMKAHVAKQRRAEYDQRMWTIGERIASGKNKLAKPKTITLKDGFKVDSWTNEPVGGKDWSDGWEKKVTK